MARKSRKAAAGAAAVPSAPAAKVWRCAVYTRLSCRNNWQTRRNRDSITFDEWVDLDLLYIKKCSVWSDLKLIVQTVGVVLTAQGN